jgi:Heterokaryon incompatibility protein (HET)
MVEADRQLPLWIDAICVNQQDSNERDAQVRRMKSIYEQAEQVIIWLGRYNEPTDGSFRFDLSKYEIDKFDENSEAMARAALVLAFVLKEEGNQQQTSELLIGLEDCNHTSNLQVWIQLSRLFHRPWFERLWIIQELAVSRQAIVLWGNLQVPWINLERAAKFILRPGDAKLPANIRKLFPLLGAHRITQVALQSMYNFDTKNVLTILHNTQNTKCSDPRDRLYAIRGIVEDNEDIEIDYSISVQQVYRNWAEKRIKRTRSLDIFSACADSSRGGDLPSWVPDLRRPFGKDRPLWIASQSARNPARLLLDNPSNPIRFGTHSFSEDGLKIRLFGKHVGKISKLTNIGDAVTNLPDPTDLGARLRQIIANWETTLNTPQEQSGEEFFAPRGFKETILRSFYPWSYMSETSDVLSMPYDIWRSDHGSRHTLSEYVDSGHWDVSRHDLMLKDFERDLFPRVHGCQMLILENGSTGIVAGNCQTQVGDQLWLLSGGLTALILRHANEVEHRLISPCYLFGTMYLVDVDRAWQEVVLV